MNPGKGFFIFNFNNMKKALLLLLTFFLLFTLTGCGRETVTKFKKPDIKDDFCGVDISFKYCKCAFHNEFCDDIGMKRGEAKKYVNEEYEKWLEGKKEEFGRECESNDGIYDDGECTYCKTSYTRVGDECLSDDEFEDKDVEEEEEEVVEDEKEDEKKDEEEKGEKPEDCLEGHQCYVNGQCLPMNVECKGGAVMKSWTEVCSAADRPARSGPPGR